MNQEYQGVLWKILRKFEEISKIPHRSGHERKLHCWLIEWANEKGFNFNTDTAGNIVIRIPGKLGLEKAPTVVIQCHLDMVDAKKEGSRHDFDKDPIKLVYNGEWLTANDTTLGADNGIGIAIAMQLVEDETVKHPPLELLFTVDEERGLVGAKEIQPGFIKGGIFLNLDSEDFGVFTVSCAGGRRTTLELDTISFERIPKDPKLVLYKISVKGLLGGHSGIDIGKGRCNAIKILANVLSELKGVIRIADIKGGEKMNAIPNSAEATVAFNDIVIPEDVNEFLSFTQKDIMSRLDGTDPDLNISMKPLKDNPYRELLDYESTKKVIDFIRSIDHGVWRMSKSFPKEVAISTNLATVAIEDGGFLKVDTMQRSSSMTGLFEVFSQVESVAGEFGARISIGLEYPTWELNLDSSILEKCETVFRKCFGDDPEIKETHGGLECGIIAGLFKDMDMISFGPTIENPHTINERVNIPSIQKTWDFTVALLEELG